MLWIEANGASLRYALSGAGERVVVLIHEIGGAIESWDESLPNFEEHFRVLRYDQRGFGMSEKTRVITLESCAADLAALLDALAISTPVFLAASAMGAAIAIDFAVRHPGRVAGMVISSPATGALPAAALQGMEARIDAVAAGGMRATVDTSLQKSYPEALRVDTARFVRYRHRWMSNDPAGFSAISRLAGTMDLHPALPKIQCPTLVIGCTHDVIRPPEQARSIAEQIPGARFETAESGHFMAVQTPALFAKHVIDFFAQAR